MPLTPADVHNVAFKKPPVPKRGYDEEEVDAFLDIVEAELARLIEENNELRGGGGSGGSGASGGSGGSGASASGAGADGDAGQLRAENARLSDRVAELERALSDKPQAPSDTVPADGGSDTVPADGGSDEQAEQTRQELQAAQQRIQSLEEDLGRTRQELEQVQARAQQGASTTDQSQQAVGVLALAQQTADQHLARVKAEAERLLADAQSTAEATVTEAQQRAEELDRDSTARATQTVQDAEQRATAVTGQLEQRKAALERQVEELHTFEREYRSRLRRYLESQLHDLDAASPDGSAVDGAAEAAVNGQAPGFAEQRG